MRGEHEDKLTITIIHTLDTLETTTQALGPGPSAPPPHQPEDQREGEWEEHEAEKKVYHNVDFRP